MRVVIALQLFAAVGSWSWQRRQALQGAGARHCVATAATPANAGGVVSDEVSLTFKETSLGMQLDGLAYQKTTLGSMPSLRCVVTAVAPDSEAARLGVSDDWTVVSVNGANVESLGAQEVASKIADAPRPLAIVFRDAERFTNALEPGSGARVAKTTVLPPTGPYTEPQILEVERLQSPPQCSIGANGATCWRCATKVTQAGQQAFDGSDHVRRWWAVPGRGDDGRSTSLGKQPRASSRRLGRALSGCCVGGWKLAVPPVLGFGDKGGPRASRPAPLWTTRSGSASAGTTSRDNTARGGPRARPCLRSDAPPLPLPASPNLETARRAAGEKTTSRGPGRSRRGGPAPRPRRDRGRRVTRALLGRRRRTTRPGSTPQFAGARRRPTACPGCKRSGRQKIPNSTTSVRASRGAILVARPSARRRWSPRQNAAKTPSRAVSLAPFGSPAPTCADGDRCCDHRACVGPRAVRETIPTENYRRDAACHPTSTSPAPSGRHDDGASTPATAASRQRNDKFHRPPPSRLATNPGSDSRGTRHTSTIKNLAYRPRPEDVARPYRQYGICSNKYWLFVMEDAQAAPRSPPCR